MTDYLSEKTWASASQMFSSSSSLPTAQRNALPGGSPQSPANFLGTLSSFPPLVTGGTMVGSRQLGVRLGKWRRDTFLPIITAFHLPLTSYFASHIMFSKQLEEHCLKLRQPQDNSESLSPAQMFRVVFMYF